MMNWMIINLIFSSRSVAGQPCDLIFYGLFFVPQNIGYKMEGSVLDGIGREIRLKYLLDCGRLPFFFLIAMTIHSDLTIQVWFKAPNSRPIFSAATVFACILFANMKTEHHALLSQLVKHYKVEDHLRCILYRVTCLKILFWKDF